jgi:hypothetical protein
MMIQNLDEAMRLFRSKLKEEIVSEEKKEDYAVLLHTPVKKYCVTFKRAFYQSFEYHFLRGEGFGQVANKKLLAFCANNRIQEFIMVMPDERIYAISPVAFLKYYVDNKTDVPHLDGEIACPLKMFTRWEG